MRIAASAAAILLLQAAPCEHAGSGATVAVDLDAVARAYDDAAKGLAVAVDAVRLGDALDRPFDACLPACRGRETRRARIAPVAAEFVGKRIVFGPVQGGDFWAATSARRLRDIAGSVPASKELATRLGVRCVPAAVTVRSATEVDIVEE